MREALNFLVEGDFTHFPTFLRNCTMSESTLVPLLIGESSFAILRETGAYYFDKTATIKEILNDGNSVSLITRPLVSAKHCFSELCSVF